ncbi:TPA: hypothetical protein ACXP4D_001533 [Klebsiella pneumoniae]|nr:hypothetical protein [Klebsiella pneumoniae]
MKNEIEQIAQQNKMSIGFVSWFFNEKKANCGNVWFMMMAAMWEGWKGRSIEMDKLAAENVALKSAITDHSHSVHFCEVCGKDDPCSTDDVCYALKDIPDTDRIVAGIKADAIDEAAVELDRVDTLASTRVIGFKLREFAKQLREGAK